MTYKKYRLIVVSAAIIMILLTGWAATSAFFWIPALLFITFNVILFLLTKRVKGRVPYDERNASIHVKALSTTCNIFIALSIVGGVTLLGFSQNAYPDLIPIGLTLTGSGCAITTLYFIIYFYYRRKLSGKE